MRRLLLLPALVILVAASNGHGEVPQLIGTVGPGFTIDLTDASGAHVDTLPAGRYELLVHDLADIHNFVLGKKETGERPAQTTVEFVGDMTFTVDLTPGLWVYACSPHFQTMNGRFTVLPAAPTAPKALTATLTPAGVSLSARRIGAGRYAITVVDRSKSRSFRLVGPGVDRRTGKVFTGKVTWTLDLRRGTYRFGTDLRLSGRLAVV